MNFKLVDIVSFWIIKICWLCGWQLLPIPMIAEQAVEALSIVLLDTISPLSNRFPRQHQRHHITRETSKRFFCQWRRNNINLTNPTWQLARRRTQTQQHTLYTTTTATTTAQPLYAIGRLALLSYPYTAPATSARLYSDNYQYQYKQTSNCKRKRKRHIPFSHR